MNNVHVLPSVIPPSALTLLFTINTSADSLSEYKDMAVCSRSGLGKTPPPLNPLL